MQRRITQRRRTSPSPRHLSAGAGAKGHGGRLEDDMPRKKRPRVREEGPVCEYDGYEPSGSRSLDVARVDTLDWHGFFTGYVRHRKPLHILGHIQDNTWRVGELWDTAYLARHAGDASVWVECRSSDGRFGVGKYAGMRFREFLRLLQEGDGLHYLSAQNVRHEDLFDSPLRELHRIRGDFPLRPALLSGLVPVQVNLWMGSSTSTTSGLHHDFHDNLYIMIKGMKRFLLYPPSRALQGIATHGSIRRVHRNGLINYYCQPVTHGDGSTLAARADWVSQRKVLDAETLLEELRVRGAPREELDAAEDALEDALDQRLECECRSDLGEETWRGNGGADDPPNFSSLCDEDQRDLEKECITVDVEAGQMLYLPCGWFHNVISFKEDAEFHMAMNYWFAPPDGQTSDSPYVCEFWEDAWNAKAHC